MAVMSFDSLARAQSQSERSWAGMNLVIDHSKMASVLRKFAFFACGLALIGCQGPSTSRSTSKDVNGVIGTLLPEKQESEKPQSQDRPAFPHQEKKFPQDYQTQVDLIQIALSALPGVHINPLRKAFEKQKDLNFQGLRLRDRCRLSDDEADEGVRQFSFAGKQCPITVEVETFPQAVDLEKDQIQFRENVLYYRKASSRHFRDGLELHSTFKLTMDRSSGQPRLVSVGVVSRGKHLRLGLLDVQGQLLIGAQDRNKKSLTVTIINQHYESTVVLLFKENRLLIDGVSARAYRDRNSRSFTTPPNFSELFVVGTGS